MNNRPDQREYAVQTGAIMVLRFVVLVITIFRLQGLPQETIETELEHNQEVTDQLEAFRFALAETTATGTPQTTLTLGMRYDGRLFFIYPPPTAGSLGTTGPANVTIENATTEESAFWNGEARNYTTRSIQYGIDYRELSETPSYTFEYGFAAAEFENTTRVRLPVDQPVIDKNEISLVVYDGELAEQSPTTESVAVERMTDSTTITVTEGDGPITLNLSTNLDEETWNETLQADEQSHIAEWTHEDGAVSVERDDSDPYEPTINKVGVGSNATELNSTYLRELERENDEIIVDVRTAYNDPIDETVGAWVFENEMSTPEEMLRIPPAGETYDAAGLDEPCLSIERDIENAASYETLDIGESGGCR